MTFFILVFVSFGQQIERQNETEGEGGTGEGERERERDCIVLTSHSAIFLVFPPFFSFSFSLLPFVLHNHVS